MRAVETAMMHPMAPSIFLSLSVPGFGAGSTGGFTTQRPVFEAATSPITTERQPAQMGILSFLEKAKPQLTPLTV